GAPFRRLPVRLRSRIPAFAAGVGAAGLVLVSAFPLITGAVVPDRRPLLPPAHVVLPPYWQEMTAYINALGERGSLLVLPPDDFYQMPYRWGYYGNDGFIANMISRPVILPNEQGYLTTQTELVSAVSSATQALADHDWAALQSIMGALESPLILVRQDI